MANTEEEHEKWEDGMIPAPGFEHESELDFAIRMTEMYRKAKEDFEKEKAENNT